MASGLSAKHFHDEQAAYDYVEARLWPHGPVCPRCGGLDRIGKMGGKSTRIGAYKCYECRKPFTVKIGTIFEASHVPMNIWLQAMYLIAGSKKGISSNQLHRILGVTLKTAWFMSHRIREAMRSDAFEQFGSGGGIVEADEIFIGREPDVPVGRGYKHKMKVLSLLDRNSGRKRSMVIDGVTIADVTPILQANIAKEADLMTDDAGQYRFMYRHFASHNTTPHMKGVYVDPRNPEIHTNAIEGSFSIFKRGMRGIYQHCAKKHLRRYLAEFDFRYSNRAAVGFNDNERVDEILKGVVGKRLTYERVGA